MKKVCGNCRFCNRAISSMPCRICKDWNKWKPKKETTEFTIEELEKIKTEIDDLDRHFDNDYFSGNKESMFKCKEVFEIIDNRIKELKGENNAE